MLSGTTRARSHELCGHVEKWSHAGQLHRISVNFAIFGVAAGLQLKPGFSAEVADLPEKLHALSSGNLSASQPHLFNVARRVLE
jgi:hypothetical protein